MSEQKDATSKEGRALLAGSRVRAKRFKQIDRA